MPEWRKYTKEEIIALGEKNNNLRYQSLIKRKYGEEYLNPLFIGCCVKFEEVMDRMHEVNGYNGAAYYYYSLGPYPKYTYPDRSEMDFYENVVEKGYLDLTFVNKLKEISDEELFKLVKEKRQREEAKRKPQLAPAPKKEVSIKSSLKGNILTLAKGDVYALGVKKIERYKKWFPNTTKEFNPLLEGSKVVYGYLKKYSHKATRISKKTAKRNDRTSYTKYSPSVKPKEICARLLLYGYFKYDISTSRSKYKPSFDDFYRDMEMGMFDDD